MAPRKWPIGEWRSQGSIVTVRTSGVSLAPIIHALIERRDAKERRFIEGSADQLQSDGQAIARKSAGDGNRRESREIRWPGMPDNRGAHAKLFPIDAHGFGVDEGGGDGNCGRHDG